MATKEDVIAFLASCSGNELNEVLNRVLPTRPETETIGDLTEKRLVLCDAMRFLQSGSWTEWHFSVIADMDEEQYERDFAGEPFLKGGSCRNCNAEVASYVKLARCPLCGQNVGFS